MRLILALALTFWGVSALANEMRLEGMYYKALPRDESLAAETGAELQALANSYCQSKGFSKAAAYYFDDEGQYDTRAVEDVFCSNARLFGSQNDVYRVAIMRDRKKRGDNLSQEKQKDGRTADEILAQYASYKLIYQQMDMSGSAAAAPQPRKTGRVLKTR